MTSIEVAVGAGGIFIGVCGMAIQLGTAAEANRARGFDYLGYALVALLACGQIYLIIDFLTATGSPTRSDILVFVVAVVASMVIWAFIVLMVTIKLFGPRTSR